MKDFTIIIPVEKDRLYLLKNSLNTYFNFLSTDNIINIDIEFIFVTRTINNNDLYEEKIIIPNNIPYKIIRYDYIGEYFNPSKALNIGIINASFDNIIITSPEVKPITNIIYQLYNLPEGNYVCQVFDSDENGNPSMCLVNSNFRSENPGMYFLACFRKKSIYTINGWDERFMEGYAYEDNDFGRRFVDAGLKFCVRDDIIGLHQYHQRKGFGSIGWTRNEQLYQENIRNGVIRPRLGLIKT